MASRAAVITRRWMFRLARLFQLILFAPAVRYPADPRSLFILAVGVLSGASAIASGAEPQTLDALLPDWGILLWSIGLTTGCALAFGGVANPRLSGAVVEQFGCMIIGLSVFYYLALVVVVTALTPVEVPSIQVLGIVFGWGAACFLRAWQLQRYIRGSSRERLL